MSRTLVLLLAVLGLQIAAAHPFVVIGHLEITPNPPVPGEPIHVDIRLEEQTQKPVPDAVMFLEFRIHPPDYDSNDPDRIPILELPIFYNTELPLEEYAEAQYRITFPSPPSGDYYLTIRDRTYPAEDALATIEFMSGQERPYKASDLLFILPPTDITPAKLATWIAWLIAIPLVAGILVTVLVLRSDKPEQVE